MGSESGPIWSIITVTYNSAQDIAACWTGWSPGRDVEWIVVDNASSDGSASAARLAGASQVIELATNRGFGAANNVGIAASSGAYILFANPDLHVRVGDLARLAGEIDLSGGLVAPQLLNPDGSAQPNGRGLPTIWNKVGNRLRSRPNADYQLVADQDQTVPICFAIGAAIAASRETIGRLNGWDERFFVYYEDSDICLREWARGGQVRLVGAVRWVHRWARATLKMRWEPWRLEFAAMAVFYSRYPALLLPNALAQRFFPTIVTRVFGRGVESAQPAEAL